MRKVREILKSLPFLSHLTHEEHELFFMAGRVSSLKQGQFVDLKKSSSLNIVISGMFEIETTGNRDVVYLSPGSFFGFLPFSDSRIKGNVRALSESEIFIISENSFYSFFLESHKAMRGYLKLLCNMGFDLNETGDMYNERKSRFISVYSTTQGTGKSYLSSLLTRALGGEPVILLDLSYSGKTVFDYFNERITVPLSVKDSEAGSAESLINDRIVRHSDNIHLLNISFSSRVKTDPGILKPVLLYLTGKYRYIIADISEEDHDLRDAVLKLSDYIFAITDGKKNIGSMQKVFDEVINEGQRIVYVRNSYFSGEKGAFFGGLILNKCSSESPGTPDVMDSFIKEGNLSQFTSMLTERSRALVLPSARLESILLCSLLTELCNSRKKIDYIYSSSYTFFLLSIFLLFENPGELKENLKRFFSPEQVSRNLDITFPEKFIFSNSKIIKYAFDLASSGRMEMFNPLPLCLLENRGVGRIKGSGSLYRVMAACLTSLPGYQPVDINGEEFTSGFPAFRVNPAHLLRTSADIIYSVTVSNKEAFQIPDGLYNNFYTSEINISEEVFLPSGAFLEQGRNLILEVSESEFKFDRIFNSTLKNSQLLLAKIE